MTRTDHQNTVTGDARDTGPDSTAAATTGSKDSKGQSVFARELLTALLYFVGIMNVIAGISTFTSPQPGVGIGMIIAGLMVLPVIRRATFARTGWRMPTLLRVFLFFALPGLTGFIPFETQQAAAERQRLTAELAADRPAIIGRIKTMISRKDFDGAIDLTDHYRPVSDPEVKELGSKAASARDEIRRAKAAADADKARRAQEARCEADDNCMINQWESEARKQCKPIIEAYANYDHEWTDGFSGPKTFFAGYVDRQAGTIRFSGNQLRLQNGFGVWKQYRYECLFSYRLGKVVNAMINT